MASRRSDAHWLNHDFAGVPGWGLVVSAMVVAAVGVLLFWKSTQPDPTPSWTPVAQESATPEPSEASEPLDVVFIGDSYTAGDGLPFKTSNRWPRLLAAEVGWREYNYGMGGSGYTLAGELEGADTYGERIATITEDPDIIVVSGGRNDIETRYQESVGPFFTDLRAAFPDAEIIAIEPFYDDDIYPANLNTLSALVQESVEAVGGRYIAGPGHALVGHAEWVLEDGIHPNVAGHAELAARIAAAL